MEDTAFLTPNSFTDVGRTVTCAFTEAINAHGASSSLERIESIRMKLRDFIAAALAGQMRLHNARLSLQNRLPPEVWLNIWARLPFVTRIAVTHVSSSWRELSVHCPDLWTAIDCTTRPGRGGLARYNAHTFHCSLSLIAMTLSRANGRPLSLSISLDPLNADLHIVDRLLAMLRPHAHEIVEIDALACSVQKFHLLLGHLQPLSSLRRLSYDTLTMPVQGGLPPLFPERLQCPVLQSIRLSTDQDYHWSWYPTSFTDTVPAVRVGEAPFPSVEDVCVAPVHEVDIAQALHDCPGLTSLSLTLSHFQWSSGQFDAFDLPPNRLTDLRLNSVPTDHVHEALGFYRAQSTLQHFSVMLMDFPRALSTPERLSYLIDDFSIPPQLSTPSLAPFAMHEESTQASASHLSGPKDLYRGLVKATRGALRRRQHEAAPRAEELDSQEAVINLPAPPPVSHGFPPAALPAELTYDSTALQSLSDVFRDLNGPVDIVLCSVLRGWRPRPSDSLILRAADVAGRTRPCGLGRSDSDVTRALLAHVWRVVQPRHVASEAELVPLLLASLEGHSPAASLELLFAQYYGFHGERLCPAMPATEPRFPQLRALRLGPRYADSASQTVLSADDIAVLAGGLGARLPLVSITLCRGVAVQDATVLNELAGAVVLRADPSRALFRGLRSVYG